ncbi:MAG: flagellar motor protein MotB [Candidatus Marinimicrobia bacterium]|nr:flagellar motor protein MotB [Candidatus Neomarinimicrobiota bacterium]
MPKTVDFKKGFKAGVNSVDEGLPGWFGTFADMMTLLMAFFVLLVAMSTLDPVKLQEMADSMGKSVGTKKKMEGAMNLADIKSEVVAMLEKQENEEIKEKMEVFSTPKGLVISISQEASFDPGSANLKPQFQSILDELVPIINNPTNYHPVLIEGHTDDRPIPKRLQKIFPTNWELSSARATSVVRRLINMDVDPLRLEATGVAEFSPREKPPFPRLLDQSWIAETNNSPEGRAKNRRVEILFPKKSMKDQMGPKIEEIVETETASVE